MTLFPLVATDLTRTFGSRRVLDGVSLTVAPSQRIGLIGENGVGKSTLLRILAGRDAPDNGTVSRPQDVGFLEQEPFLGATSTVQDIIDGALSKVRNILAELDRLATTIATIPVGSVGHAEALAAYGRCLERAQEGDAWDADRHADLVLDGIGLAALSRHRKLASLSGGQRGRLALAALLIRRPSAFLLDEPTNHLDDAAMEFVEQQLVAQRGVVVVASHDRAFLEVVCTDLVDLDRPPTDRCDTAAATPPT